MKERQPLKSAKINLVEKTSSKQEKNLIKKIISSFSSLAALAQFFVVASAIFLVRPLCVRFKTIIQGEKKLAQLKTRTGRSFQGGAGADGIQWGKT